MNSSKKAGIFFSIQLLIIYVIINVFLTASVEEKFVENQSEKLLMQMNDVIDIIEEKLLINQNILLDLAKNDDLLDYALHSKFNTLDDDDVAFEINSLSDFGLKKQNIDIFVITDSAGNILYEKNILNDGTNIREYSSLIQNSKGNLLYDNQGILFSSNKRITDFSGKVKSDFYLIIGQLVDKSYFNFGKQVTKIEKINNSDDISSYKILKQIDLSTNSLGLVSQYVVDTSSNSSELQVQSIIKDATGQSYIKLSIDSSNYYTESIKNTKLLLYFVFAIFAIILITTWVFMYTIFVKNISKVADMISNLKYQKLTEGNFEIISKNEFDLLENKIEELVSEINVYSSKLSEISYVDDLTGLLNRSGLSKKLYGYTASRSVNSFKGTLLFLDIDHFKEINDGYGNKMGDEILIEFAKRLKNSAPKGSIIARVSGDEFIIYIDRYFTKLETENYVQSLMENLGSSYEMGDYIIHITISIGVAYYPSSSKDVDELIIKANLALDKVKRSGRNSFLEYSPDMQGMIKGSDILDAIINKEIFMLYQPQINSSTGKLEGVEALVRWKSPKYGFVSPDEFIWIAEDSGVIHELGKYITEEVFLQVAKWKKSGINVPKTSINLSPVQLLDKYLFEYIIGQFDTNDLETNKIVFEITEEMPIGNQNQIYDNLNKLNENGIAIYIDDFGKAYSTLSYLSELPISGVKIDKCFVDKVEESDSIIKIMFMLAKSLDLKVVVEGVETEVQKDIISNISECIMQGYLYSKPISSREIEEKYFNNEKK